MVFVFCQQTREGRGWFPLVSLIQVQVLAQKEKEERQDRLPLLLCIYDQVYDGSLDGDHSVIVVCTTVRPNLPSARQGNATLQIRASDQGTASKAIWF